MGPCQASDLPWLVQVPAAQDNANCISEPRAKHDESFHEDAYSQELEVGNDFEFVWKIWSRSTCCAAKTSYLGMQHIPCRSPIHSLVWRNGSLIMSPVR